MRFRQRLMKHPSSNMFWILAFGAMVFFLPGEQAKAGESASKVRTDAAVLGVVRLQGAQALAQAIGPLAEKI